MIRLTKKLRDFSSDQIRCGTITFSDISEAKEEGHIKSTTNSKDIEKLGLIILQSVKKFRRTGLSQQGTREKLSCLNVGSRM